MVEAIVSLATRETFQADGFVTPDGLLSPAELQRFGGAVEDAVAARTVNDTRALGERQARKRPPPQL